MAIPTATRRLIQSVKWASKEYVIEVQKNSAARVSDLKQAIEIATGVAVDSQKLLNIDHKVRNPTDRTKISKLGLKHGHKIVLVKSSSAANSGESEDTAPTAKTEQTEAMPNDIEAEAVKTDCVIKTVLGNKLGDFPIDPNHTCNDKNLGVLDPSAYVEEIEQLVKNGDVKMMSVPRNGKKLLVLDLDHTVFDNDRKATTKIELIRPFLHEFLTAAYRNYDLMIWSATSMESLEAKIRHYGVAKNPNYKIVACFDVTTMLKIEVPGHGSLGVKPLGVIWGKFPGIFTPKNTIILDDTPKNFLLNPKNGVLIRSFRDAHVTRKEDEELKYLTEYLDDIALVEDLSEKDHGNWEEHRLSTGEMKHLLTQE